MRTIYNLMLTALLLGFAATAAHAQFEFAAKQPLQVQGVMDTVWLSNEQTLVGPDGSTYLMGAFKNEFEFAGKKFTPGTGKSNSYLLKYNPDGAEAWGMYVTSDTIVDDWGDVIRNFTKVQSAIMVGENLLVAVRIKGKGVMFAADGTVDSIKGGVDDLRVLLMQISPSAELLKKVELRVEDVDYTGFMPLDPSLNICKMGVLENGQLCLAGNLKGKLSVDGVEIMSSNLYDVYGMGSTTHSIAFCARYDITSATFERVDTIRPRGFGSSIQLLSAAIDGNDVYLALNAERKVGSGEKEWDVTFVDGEYNQNGLLLAKFNATGLEWDALTVVENLSDIMYQPYVKPYAMEVVGEELLMAGLFSVKADFGNGVELNTLAPTPDAIITDYFFAKANTADGTMLDAFVFGVVDTAEVELPDGATNFSPSFREHIQLVTDGTSAFLMGAYKGTISTPAGNFTSLNDSIDNFLLRYNLIDRKWDGMSFGGPKNDYAASLHMVGDSLLVAGAYTGSISFNSTTTLSSEGTGYNAYCVYYVPDQFDITLSTPGNGVLLTSPASVALAGRTVTIFATPAGGYRLKEGSLKVYETADPSNVVELSNNSFTMPRFAVTVEAEFEEVPIRSLEVQASPAEGGSISGQGTDFVDGATVTLTATPASGYKFVKWTEGGADVSTDNPYTFSITADRSLVAVFEKTTGLLNARYEQLSVRPNPTKGMLWVSVPELVEGTAAEVLVFNASGQLVLRQPASSSGSTTIDLTNMPDGIYIVRSGNAVARVAKR